MIYSANVYVPGFRGWFHLGFIRVPWGCLPRKEGDKMEVFLASFPMTPRVSLFGLIFYI